MKQVAATALILLLLLFLIPLLVFRGNSSEDTPEEEEIPVLTPAPSGVLDTETTITVRQSDGTTQTLVLGDYLWRVVAAEMPASFEEEALKAQAVAARTYAMRRMASPPAAHPDAAVCTDYTCCQAYITPESAASNWGDKADYYTAKIKNAVSGTDGVVARYNGALIDAVFFSSAAGRTVDAVEVWGNSVPYLTSVESPEGEEVPNWRSTVTVTTQEFRDTFLAAHPEAKLDGDASTWFGTVETNSGGGVSTIVVGGVTVKGTEMRTLFSLRSVNFTVSVSGEEITFSVTGYGHGVGMSQYGANALAKEGKTYEEILEWYYTGITLEPIEGTS